MGYQSRWIPLLPVVVVAAFVDVAAALSLLSSLVLLLGYYLWCVKMEKELLVQEEVLVVFALLTQRIRDWGKF